jgi:death-on-curing protein
MRYISADDIVFIHDVIIIETGGALGVREPGLLLSIAEKPKTRFGTYDLYPDVYVKAASLYESICNYHVFIDGNKRTSAIAMYRFLYINGYELTATNKELVQYTLQITTTKPDIVDIAKWIKKHSRKVKTI